MGEKCLKCKKRISITNLRHFQCKTCRKLCHQNCVKGIQAVCLKKMEIIVIKSLEMKNGNVICTLQELPTLLYSITVTCEQMCEPCPGP